MIRVATFNVRHGLAEGAEVPDPAATATVAAALGADVLALQELDVDVDRSGWTDQLALVRDAIPGAEARFARTVSVGGGEYGIGLVVRCTTSDLEDLELAGRGEPRRAIVARVAPAPGPDGSARPPCTVAATHLQNDRRVARTQLVDLLELLDDRPGPTVLLGDLNLPPFVVEGVCSELAWDAIATPATFPARSPRVQIDWVLTRGFELVAVVVPDVRVSDHRPVVAELRPTGDPRVPSSS